VLVIVVVVKGKQGLAVVAHEIGVELSHTALHSVDLALQKTALPQPLCQLILLRRRQILIVMLSMTPLLKCGFKHVSNGRLLTLNELEALVRVYIRADNMRRFLKPNHEIIGKRAPCTVKQPCHASVRVYSLVLRCF
jgi:hypothetical protein